MDNNLLISNPSIDINELLLLLKNALFHNNKFAPDLYVLKIKQKKKNANQRKQIIQKQCKHNLFQ